jgi:hypothetical protein
VRHSVRTQAVLGCYKPRELLRAYLPKVFISVSRLLNLGPRVGAVGARHRVARNYLKLR